jgi:hypothetical protein
MAEAVTGLLQKRAPDYPALPVHILDTKKSKL